jgi:hypothetical protein
MSITPLEIDRALGRLSYYERQSLEMDLCSKTIQRISMRNMRELKVRLEKYCDQQNFFYGCNGLFGYALISGFCIGVLLPASAGASYITGLRGWSIIIGAVTLSTIIAGVVVVKNFLSKQTNLYKKAIKILELIYTFGNLEYELCSLTGNNLSNAKNMLTNLKPKIYDMYEDWIITSLSTSVEISSEVIKDVPVEERRVKQIEEELEKELECVC